MEGEIRVVLQYLFQAFGSRGPTKYRDMLLETGTEEIAHVEMLATAVAMNLEGAPAHMQDEAAKNPVVAAVLGDHTAQLPIPNSFPQSLEHSQLSYTFLSANIDPSAPVPQCRWSQGPSLDGKG